MKYSSTEKPFIIFEGWQFTQFRFTLFEHTIHHQWRWRQMAIYLLFCFFHYPMAKWNHRLLWPICCFLSIRAVSPRQTLYMDMKWSSEMPKWVGLFRVGLVLCGCCCCLVGFLLILILLEGFWLKVGHTEMGCLSFERTEKISDTFFKKHLKNVMVLLHDNSEQNCYTWLKYRASCHY